jgi:hypothetical protein
MAGVHLLEETVKYFLIIIQIKVIIIFFAMCTSSRGLYIMKLPCFVRGGWRILLQLRIFRIYYVHKMREVRSTTMKWAGHVAHTRI